jgi:hypothetical protein
MKVPVRCGRRIAVAAALTGMKSLSAKRPQDNAEDRARHFIDYTAAIETVSDYRASNEPSPRWVKTNKAQ